MSASRSLRMQSARAVSIVESVKELANELTLALSQDEYVNKFCLHGVITDRAKNVEYAKEKYMVAAEELENLTGQLEEAKKRLHDINVQYYSLLEENKTFENAILSIKIGDYLCDTERRQFQRSRLQLKMYKIMTGVYFDLNDGDNMLSGFVAIRSDAKHRPDLVPFILHLEEAAPTFLWEKIGEALYKDNDNLIFPMDSLH